MNRAELNCLRLTSRAVLRLDFARLLCLSLLLRFRTMDRANLSAKVIANTVSTE